VTDFAHGAQSLIVYCSNQTLPAQSKHTLMPMHILHGPINHGS
jgi:hypothetical protein